MLSSKTSSQSISSEIKEKLVEIKQEVLSTPTKPSSEVMRRRQATIENRPHGWFLVERDETDEKPATRRRKSPMKEQAKESVEQSETVAPKEEDSTILKEQLSHFEERERNTAGERQKLEAQLEDLLQKYNTDEKALATFEHDKQRFKHLIAVEQKKCFDFQQQIISLKNQLKNEHESKLKTEEQIEAMKKQQKTDKRHAKKATKAEAKEVSAPATVSEPASTPAASQSDLPAHGAWHMNSHLGFTEMVAQAQKEEQEHGKTFSEILKDSIKPVAPATPVEEKAEFIVVGGDLSSQHVFGKAPVSAI